MKKETASKHTLSERIILNGCSGIVMDEGGQDSTVSEYVELTRCCEHCNEH